MKDLSSTALATVETRALLPTIRPLLTELSAYDATYLALALSSGYRFATFDRLLSKVASSHDVRLAIEP